MSKPKLTQTWALVSDFHVGSHTALTTDPKNAIQKGVLERYKDAVAWMSGRPDVAVLNGDGIDGQDRRGRDIDMTDMFQQAEKAAELLFMQRAEKEYIVIAGTAYHEDADANQFSKAIVSHLRYLVAESKQTGVTVSWYRKLNTTINGWFRLEARHKISRSNIPHGKSTAQARAKIWNVLNAAQTAARTGKPIQWPHLIVFGHVHYWNRQEDSFGSVCSLPGWQAIGSRYGDEQCEGHCDLGMCKLVVHPTEDEGWELTPRLYLPAVVSRVEHR